MHRYFNDHIKTISSDYLASHGQFFDPDGPLKSFLIERMIHAVNTDPFAL